MRVRTTIRTAAAGAVLAMASMAQAKPIFDVTFDTSKDTTGSVPYTTTSPSGTPPYAYPYLVQTAGANTALVQSGSTATDFSTFGTDQFAVMTSTDAANNTNNMELRVPAGDQLITGTATLKLDFQYNSKAPNGGGEPKGNFSVRFRDAGTLIVDFTQKQLIISRANGQKDVIDYTGLPSAGQSHTIEGILTMNGANSKIDFKLDGQLLHTEEADTINLGATFYRIQLQLQGSDVNTQVGVDNIQLDLSSTVPEPASMGLLGVGGLWLLGRRRGRS